MRRGEIVAIRWGEIDFAAGRVKVERSLEQTNAGLDFKAPKTKAGRRAVSIPPSVVAELRRHWRQQQEVRLALGSGKAGSEDLVFARHDGNPYPPDSLTADWARTVRILHLPKVTFHALRHTHVSQLIAEGIDVVTVSRRIGHSKPSITMDVYSHLFGNTDERAAEVVQTAMAHLLSPTISA
jgi:integrase